MTAHPNRKRTMATSVAVAYDHDRNYGSFLSAVIKSFEDKLATSAALFETNTEGLYNAYLNNLPETRHFSIEYCI